MHYLIVSQDEPVLSVVSEIDDDLLEEAVNGDVEIVQVTKKGIFEKFDPDTGVYKRIEKREDE